MDNKKIYWKTIKYNVKAAKYINELPTFCTYSTPETNKKLYNDILMQQPQKVLGSERQKVAEAEAGKQSVCWLAQLFQQVQILYIYVTWKINVISAEYIHYY